VSGSSYTAEFWQYDSRLARRWNQDPKPNTSISNYATFANNPIIFNDPLGDTIVISLHYTGDASSKISKANSQMVSEQVNDGYFILSGHGSPEGIDEYADDGSANFLTSPKQILAVLEKNENWNQAKKEGLDITLILKSCNTGAEPTEYFGENPPIDKSIAQRLSEEDPNITVVAPDGYVRSGIIKKMRKGLIGRKGKYGLKGIRSLPDIDDDVQKKNEGGWITFRKGQKVSKLVVGADVKIGATKKRGKKIKYEKK